MKKISRLLLFVLALTAVLISACGAAASTERTVAQKAQADVAFTGVIQAMNGNQWTINGQTVAVEPSVVRDGPFKVGDTVKVEAVVAQDGSVTVTRVEKPTAQDLAAPSQSETQVSDSPEAPSDTPAPVSPPDVPSTPQPIVFDNQGNEASGTVDSVTTDTIVIGGKSFTVANGAEFKDQIAAGDFVKVHFVVNADGSLSITEIEKSAPSTAVEDNSGSSGNGTDDGPNHDANDDNGNDNKSGDNSGKDGGSDDSSGSGHD